jgi:hypothetical protein
MGIEPTNLLHAMQALYQLSYAPRWSPQTSNPVTDPGKGEGASRQLEAASMAFKGWPASALEFYEGLEAGSVTFRSPPGGSSWAPGCTT